MANNKKPDFNNLQMPPMWTGVAGQGNQQIFSIGGKWHKVGDTVGDGYKVLGMDSSGGLALSWNGLPISMKLRQGTVAPYTPPQTFQQTSNPVQQQVQQQSNPLSGAGQMTDAEMKLALARDSIYESVSNAEDFIYKSVSKESMDMIRENTKQSPYMTDEDKANILHYDEYMEKLKNNTLKKGVKYFVPAMQEDGNVDFHIFMDER